MRLAVTVARVLAGLPLLVFGLNGFLHFFPQPPLEGASGAFLSALAASGYLLPLVSAVEVVVGALFLANRWVPLAAVLLVPVMLNAFLYHVFLDPAGTAPSAIILALTAFLMWAYRGYYAPLKRAKAEPTAAGVAA